MVFTKPEPRTPTSLGRLVVTLIDQPESNGQPVEKTAWYTLEILDQDGAQIPGSCGDLVPHLSGEQIQVLLAFIADLRELAEQQILGGE